MYVYITIRPFHLVMNYVYRIQSVRDPILNLRDAGIGYDALDLLR